ncbi:ribonuclease E activity regulator RraA [Gammaproteobacteria bacterium]|nr:ribonuclease E activity regulator RraA [Gammaproteobacteria bacterium]
MMTLPDLSDKYPDQIQIGKLTLKPYGRKGSMIGEIYTVSCSDDNSIVKSVLSRDGQNKILVIDASGVSHASMVGDQIAEAALKNNWAGIFVNGYVRDVEILRTLDLPIFARGSVVQKTDKQDHGFEDIMISFGSTIMHSGNWLYVDENGWLVADTKLKF